MELILILIAILLVVIFTVFSFYTGVNSGASKFQQWFEKLFNNKID